MNGEAAPQAASPELSANSHRSVLGARSEPSECGGSAGSEQWTAADSAELDVLVHRLVTDYFEHRDKCARCASPELCPHVSAAISEVCNWRDARVLLSRAEALRAEQRRLAS